VRHLAIAPPCPCSRLLCPRRLVHLQPTSCAMLIALCAPSTKPNTPYLTSFPQRYCCLQIAICLPREYAGSIIVLLGLAFLLLVFLRTGFCCSAVRISLLRLTRTSAVCSLSHRVPILRHTDNIPVAAHLNSMLSASPKSNCLDMSSAVFTQGFT
jgi:hypothetical protein